MIFWKINIFWKIFEIKVDSNVAFYHSLAMYHTVHETMPKGPMNGDFIV